MNKLVYIVGGGTFAIKLAKVLIDNSINFEFVDELSARTLLGRNVYKAIDVPNVMAYFIIAISHPQYANNAIDRLCDVGVIRSNILPLIYESAANVLEHMLNVDKFRFWRLLDENDGNFLSLEKKFFVENYNDLKHNSSNKKNIGFYYIGKGGGFRGHVLNLPLLLNENFEVKEFSDQPAHLHNIESYNVMSEHAMLDNSWPDIVINPHFFECSPSNLPKLTMMHMVYDFLVYKDLVARVMGQPETHYLFIPSKPSMMLHQNICKQYKLKNNIVLIPGGYPKLDDSIRKYESIISSSSLKNSIIYAPTLSALMTTDETKFTYSIFDAVEFIPAILSAFPDKNIIFRPHPDDLSILKQGVVTKRANAFRTLLELCESDPRCSLDSGQSDYLSTFEKACVLISDTSAIAYSFALITKKPVIFYSADQNKVRELMADVAYINDRDRIGCCVDSIPELLNSLSNYFELDSKIDSDRVNFCDDIVYNKGKSLQYLIDNFDYIVSGEKHPEWWYSQDHC